MTDELNRFVASLAIPADRKAVVLAELADHVACASEAAAREGRDPGAAGREALGNLEALRRSLEAIEPAFRTTRRQAMARGIAAGVVVAVVVAHGGSLMAGPVGALVVIAIAVAFAPPRALELLRAELRAPRIRGALGLGRGIPIGPVLVYAYCVLAAQSAVWIGMIVVGAFGGVTDFETPPAAFADIGAVYLVLLVEGIRARRTAAA